MAPICRTATRLPLDSGGRCRSTSSVGPGAVLHELLGCGKLPSVILDKVFRQSEGSIVAENAQRIRHGNERLDLGDDFQFWASADVSQSAQWLERLYMNEIARHGVTMGLTPFHKSRNWRSEYERGPA